MTAPLPTRAPLPPDSPLPPGAPDGPLPPDGPLSPDGPLRPGAPLAEGYRIVEHLSRGVTLDVYSVWSSERDCLCIAKTVRPDQLEDDGARRHLLYEGQLLMSLNHPHLVRGYEIVSADRGPAVIMQTLTDDTLSCVIDSHSPNGLDNDDVAILGRQLCAVVGYLHRHGHLHLDLKPSNIVCTAGAAVVLDLSLAQRPGKCRAGAGTAEYMAPEQVVGGWVDSSTDVWGVGAVLYRALTGRRPFAREGRTQDTVADMRALDRPDIDPLLADLVAQCLHAAPAARATLDSLAQQLDQVIEEAAADAASAPA